MWSRLSESKMAAGGHFENEYRYNFKTNWNMSKITNLDLRNPFLNIVFHSGAPNP